MFHIILFEPEIPPNTGNIIRLSVNIGCELHLIRPLGFSIDQKSLRRAGMDYISEKQFNIWDNLDSCLNKIRISTIYSVSTKGEKNYTDINFRSGDAFIFGPESRGLPKKIRNDYTSIFIPMRSKGRSINLANAVSVILYEAWRQLDFN